MQPAPPWADAGTGGPRWSPRRVSVAAVALTLAAALIRWLARPGRPMWGDEAFTLALVRYPPGEVWEFLTHREVNGGIYALLFRGLAGLVEPLGVEPLTVARGLSGLFGVAAVPAFYLLARRLAGERVALLAGLLLTVNLFHVSYSSEARAYSLAALLVILSTAALLDLLEAPRWGEALAFGVLAGLATWAHLFAALVLAAQLLAAPFHPRFAAGWRRILAGLGLAGALSLLVVARSVWGDGGQVSWIGPLTWDQVELVLTRWSGGVRLLPVFWAIGLGAGLVGVFRARRAAFPLALATALGLVPLLLAMAVSAVKPLLVPRYLLVALPGFLLVAALGLDALRRRALVFGLAALVLALGLREVALDQNGDPPWQRIDELAARLLEVARPGDVLVVSHPAMAVTLDQELLRLGRGTGPERASPVEGDPLDLHGERRPPLEERIRGRTGVIFLTFAEQPQSALLREALSARGRVTSDESYDGVRLVRVEPRPGG